MQTGCEKYLDYVELGRLADLAAEKRLAEYRFGEATDDEVKFQAEEVRDVRRNSQR